MKEFVLIFRNSFSDQAPSPEQMQQVLSEWMNWMGNVAAQDKLVDKGNRLSMTEAKTISADNSITDGPYTEIKEFINGYIIVKTADINEAMDIARGCPILKIGGKVEVRAIVTPNDNS